MPIRKLSTESITLRSMPGNDIAQNLPTQLLVDFGGETPPGSMGWSFGELLRYIALEKCMLQPRFMTH